MFVPTTLCLQKYSALNSNSGFVHACNFKINYICEEPLSPAKNIYALHKEIQRRPVSGKLTMKACFVVWTVALLENITSIR